MFKEIKNPKNGRKYIYPMRTYLLSTKSKNNKTNLITVDWVMPVSINPPLLAASIGTQRYSQKVLKNSKDYVISVPNKNILEEVWISGTKSGRNVNKFEETELTKMESNNVESFSIKEAVANIECKITEKKKFGDHYLYIGEIIGGTYDEETFKNDKPTNDLKSGLLMHLSDNEFLEENIKKTFKP